MSKPLINIRVVVKGDVHITIPSSTELTQEELIDKAIEDMFNTPFNDVSVKDN